MHVHIYVQHITITDIINFMHSYHRLIQVLMLITRLCLFETPVRVTELIHYSLGITDQNNTPSFPLIHYSGYYHIAIGIPRPVLIKV